MTNPWLLVGLARNSPPWQPRTPEESQVKSCEHQDNANIRHQPFPEQVSEEREIYSNYNGHHRDWVKHAYAHFQ
jgi:hypothetical protein